MNLPEPDDYIDIHTHGAVFAPGIYSVENLMAHEGKIPHLSKGVGYTAGIHPWYLNENNREQLVEYVRRIASDPYILAVGEAGFDRLRGPSSGLQKEVFEEQALIAVAVDKPIVIHCVKSWNELLDARTRFKKSLPWLIHGFRGKPELARQLISHGMYISFWFDFIMQPRSSVLLKELPADRIFLETDGAGIDIKDIYRKVSGDLDMDLDDLKRVMYDNFMRLFHHRMN